MLNTNELNKRITLLSLESSSRGYKWEATQEIWAKVEYPNRPNNYSCIGMGATAIRFSIRKRSDITLHNAFRYQGKHCFLTDIREYERAYLKVSAALVEPLICTVERMGEPRLDELNRPVYGCIPDKFTFPGCLTEKYQSHVQEKPIANLESRYVLVVPKPVRLRVGEIVMIAQKPYVVVLPHELDMFKNEYELITRDVT